MAPSSFSKEQLESKTLVTRRERLFSRLQVTYDLISRLPDDEDIFLARAAKLASDLEDFERVQSNIARLNAIIPESDYVDTEASSASYDDLYFRIHAKADSLRATQLNVSVNNSIHGPAGAAARGTREDSVRPKLPPIQIPKFKGDLDKFPAFRSLFDTLIHNSDLPDIQKFSFLKTYLEYPASSTVEHFEFTEENYQPAYTKLIAKYTDKRLVGTHILNRLLQFKPSSSGRVQTLRQFVDVFCVQYESLKALNIPQLSDFIICTIALKILDSDTKRLFEEKYAETTFPRFSDLAQFVQQQCKIASLIAPTQKGAPSRLSVSANRSIPRSPTSSNVPTTKTFLAKSQVESHKSAQANRVDNRRESILKCPICHAEHKIYGCPEFMALSPAQRTDKIKGLNRCFACLGHHSRSNCTSRLSCRKCHDKNHHTFLHRSETMGSTDADSGPTDTSGNSVNVLKCHTNQVHSNNSSFQGLLGTAKGLIQSSSGDWLPCRMVVDPASESSFITEHMVQALRLPRKRFPVDIMGVGNSRFSNHHGCVECKVIPTHRRDPQLSIEAIILQSISSNIPKAPIPSEVRTRFQNLRLADPDFDSPGLIDLLIGVQHYSEILGSNPTHIRGEPAALGSVFGFLILGKVPIASSPSVVSSFLTFTPSLDEILRRFWEVEQPEMVHPPNPHDEECETYFQKTTRRDDTGRYEVSLPFLQGTPPTNLGSTREVARKRLLNLERRLDRNQQLRQGYQDNLQDYVSQGHMRPASMISNYVMTHHAVVKDSTSTKIRVVFNASETSDTSRSLNDCLATGPKLQSDITDILLNFRLYEVALSADITQIPYLAQRVIKQLVNDEGDRFPLAAKALISNIYVDDIVCSVPTEESAISLYTQLEQLLKRGGFVLHKVSSNNTHVLDQVPIPKRETLVSFDQSDYVKLLGLRWDPSSDAFCYEVHADSMTPTKRGILSQVARIFDVLGYLSPVTIWIKQLIQKLWVTGVGWDEELPSEITQAWLEFHSQLGSLAQIRIARPLNVSHPAEYTILGFCDASERGYAACLYLRINSPDNEVQTHLLKAKSKVAPLKTLTIPRLELEGALLLAKLFASISNFLTSLSTAEILCFTDSSIVLAWLHTPAFKLKTFVANRVTRILETLPIQNWWHVDGINNPADVASRGIFPQLLSDHTIWWKGPDFLKTPRSSWPISKENIPSEIPELKSQTLALMTIDDPNEPTDSIIENLLSNYSSLPRIQRILSYVRRFLSNIRSKPESRIRGPITREELRTSMNSIILHTQKRYYPDVFRDLAKEREPKGFIRHLTPFISKEGPLRVGGRLTHAPLNDEQKHPLLVPRQSRVAYLICGYYHKLSLHGGPQLMQSLVQRRFWIPGFRSLARSFVFKCITCYRFKARPVEPFMSSLPSVRFQQVRAFVNTGVDLAGPYFIKESKRRNARNFKSWVVLFICLSTRAVYLDVVEDISTPAFLATLDRFIARRGVPAQLWSDMGTNFVGAARILKETMNLLHIEDEAIRKYCNERHITWKFNPPAAPHFGGSWEAAIKSAKHHMKRVMGNLIFTFPEFLTLLAKIEAILNSRPLCPVSTSPSDGFDYLTPGHFLVGAPLLLSRPEEDLTQAPTSIHTRWTLITRCVQDFWRRWSTEYVHTLIQRTKWTRKTPPISPGALVLLIDSSMPPNLWSMGRIIEGIRGSDGVTRVVKLQTPTGVLTRPLTKICVLPIGTEEQSQSNEDLQLRSGKSLPRV